MYGHSFKFKNIPFKCFLEPRTINFEKYIAFFVAYDFNKNDNQYSSITIYYELYCKQMDISWKNMAQLQPHRDNCGWPMNSLKLSTLSHYRSATNIVTTNQLQKVDKMEIDNSVQRNQFVDDLIQKSDELSFECYIEVLHYKLVPQSTTSIMNVDGEIEDEEEDEICISDREEYVWNLDKIYAAKQNEVTMYIQRLRSQKARNLELDNHIMTNKRFYSRNFGSFDSKNWCLECVINTRSMDISLYLRLVGLPANIDKIKVEFNLYAQIGYNQANIKHKVERKYIQFFDINNNSWGWSNGVLSLNSVNFVDDDQLKILSFGVILNILEIYQSDKKDATPIPPYNWLDFGVLSLSNIFSDL